MAFISTEDTVIYRMAVLVIGILMAAYWARVMRMAARAERKTGRAANLIPPRKLDRMLRLIWMPIVLIWVIHPFLVAFGPPHLRILRPLLANPWVAWICSATVAVGFWATLVCWKTMGRNWRMGIDPAERTSLVIVGPFAYVRHPIYALSQAMMLATMIALPTPLMIAAGALHVLLLQWEARREESYMREVHGQQYTEY